MKKRAFFTFSGYILAFFIAVSAVLWGQFAPRGADEPPLTVTEQNLGGGFMVFYFVSREPGHSYAVVSSQPGVVSSRYIMKLPLENLQSHSTTGREVSIEDLRFGDKLLMFGMPTVTSMPYYPGDGEESGIEDTFCDVQCVALDDS